LNTLLAHINDVPDSLKQASLAVDFPENLETLVERLLSKKPKDRHKTMREVKQDLQNVFEGKELIPATQGVQDEPKKARTRQLGRSKLIVFSAAVLISLGTIVGLGLGLNGLNKTDVQKSVRPTADAVSVGLAPTPELESKGDKSLRGEVDLKLVPDPLKLRGQDLSDKGLLYLVKNYKNRINSIDVSNTEISDQGISYLSHIPGLKILRMDRVPISIAGIRNLVIYQYRDRTGREREGPTPVQNSLLCLILEHDNVSNSAVASLAKLRRLAVLDLNHNLIDDSGLSAIAKSMSGLKELDLSHNNISDAGLVECSRLKWLMRLDASETAITDKALIRLALNRDLRTLNVSETKVTDAGLIHFLSQVTKDFSALYLASDQVSNRSMRSIARLDKLQFLDLNHTQVTDEGLMRLANNTSLKEISLDGSNVTAGGIAKFKKLCPGARVVSNAKDAHYPISIDGSYEYNLY
ncbi:MAG: hypothetical protein ACRDHZ_04250, partial [Ktedonobacteraceae bacterium]